MSFGYTWKGNNNVTHNIKPVEVNLVRISNLSSEFADWLKDKYIAYSYQSHMVSVTGYNMTFSNQSIQSKRDFIYVRYNAESAGNILYKIYQLGGAPGDSGVYQIFNTPFAQYIRNDIDFRYYNVIDKNTSLVYRIYAGAGLPYKNSKALPFEKKYFSGGANSIRAWQVRDLGPGSFKELNPGTYPNKTGDIKLEANFEYRFNLFWVLKGALFLDAGNIWAISKLEEEEAQFKFDKFYRDIAIGTGFGTRFDFSFFIFRLDLGIKLKDPFYPEGERWTIARPHGFERRDFVLNFGIGYPF
jgi:outer membrane protein assembly factor BamA